MANPEWTDPLDWETCAGCGRQGVREILDGDPLCQSCCDKWAQGEAAPPIGEGPYDERNAIGAPTHAPGEAS